jgi:hypothetical protein
MSDRIQNSLDDGTMPDGFEIELLEELLRTRTDLTAEDRTRITARIAELKQQEVKP